MRVLLEVAGASSALLFKNARNIFFEAKKYFNQPFPMLITRPYPMAFCTHGFTPGTRASVTAAFTSHGLVLRKRMRR